MSPPPVPAGTPPPAVAGYGSSLCAASVLPRRPAALHSISIPHFPAECNPFRQKSAAISAQCLPRPEKARQRGHSGKIGPIPRFPDKKILLSALLCRSGYDRMLAKTAHRRQSYEIGHRRVSEYFTQIEGAHPAGGGGRARRFQQDGIQLGDGRVLSRHRHAARDCGTVRRDLRRTAARRSTLCGYHSRQ